MAQPQLDGGVDTVIGMVANSPDPIPLKMHNKKLTIGEADASVVLFKNATRSSPIDGIKSIKHAIVACNSAVKQHGLPLMSWMIAMNPLRMADRLLRNVINSDAVPTNAPMNRHKQSLTLEITLDRPGVIMGVTRAQGGCGSGHGQGGGSLAFGLGLAQDV